MRAQFERREHRLSRENFAVCTARWRAAGRRVCRQGAFCSDLGRCQCTTSGAIYPPAWNGARWKAAIHDGPRALVVAPFSVMNFPRLGELQAAMRRRHRCLCFARCRCFALLVLVPCVVCCCAVSCRALCRVVLCVVPCVVLCRACCCVVRCACRASSCFAVSCLVLPCRALCCAVSFPVCRFRFASPWLKMSMRARSPMHSAGVVRRMFSHR